MQNINKTNVDQTADQIAKQIAKQIPARFPSGTRRVSVFSSIKNQLLSNNVNALLKVKFCIGASIFCIRLIICWAAICPMRWDGWLIRPTGWVM